MRTQRVTTTSHSSVMRGINRLGVKHPELIHLRQKALRCWAQSKGRVSNPASVAVVMWLAVMRGKTARELLDADAEALIALAQEWETEAHGIA